MAETVNKEINIIAMNNGVHKFGDIFFYIGILWMLLYNDYGVMAVGTIAFLEAGVGFLQIPLSAIIEQQNKKIMYMIAAMLRIGSIIAMLVCCVSQATIVLIAVFYFIHEISSTIISATNFSYTVKLFGKETYRIYQVKSSTLQQTVMIIATGLAGIAYFVVGVIGMLAIELLATIVFTLIVTIYYRQEPKVVKMTTEQAEQSTYANTVKSGLMYVLKERKILTIILIAMTVNMLFAPLMQVILPVIFFELDGESASIYNSIVNSCMLVGMVGMGIVFMKKANWLQNMQTFLPIGIGLTVVFLVALISGNMLFVIVGALCAGIGAKLNGAAVEFLLVNETKEDYLARVGAIFSTLSQAATVISIPIVTYLLSVSDYRWYCFGACIVFGLVGLIYMSIEKNHCLEMRM